MRRRSQKPTEVPIALYETLPRLEMVLNPTLSPPTTGDAHAIQVADRVPPEIRALLPAGQIITVTSGRDGATGESGIFFRGAFIPATLPEGTLPGQELRVRVIPSTDALVLKLLTDDVQLPKPSTTVEQQLRSMLPPSAYDALVEGGRMVQQSFSPDLLSALDKAIVRNDEVRRLVLTLTEQPAVANEEALRSPQKLAAILEQLEIPRETPHTAPSPSPSPPFVERAAQIRLLAAVRDTIAAMVSVPDSGGVKAELPPASSPAPILIAAFAYANANGAAKELIERLQATPMLRKPLEILERTLSALPPALPEDTPDPELRALRDLMRSVVSDLATLRQSHANEATVQSTLKSVHARLHAQLPPDRLRLAQQSAEFENIAKVADRALAAQESLNQANTLLHALGEPAAIFIPVLLPGLFAKWEVFVHPPSTPASDEEAGSTSPSTKALRRIELSLTLPRLGAVHADIAYNHLEILYHLQVETPAVQALAERELATLSARLGELGPTKVQGVVSLRRDNERRSHWIRELPRVGVVA